MRHEVRHLTSGRDEVHPSPGIGEDGARRQVIRHVGMRGGESRFFRSGGSVNKILGGRHGRDSHCLHRVGDGSSLRQGQDIASMDEGLAALSLVVGSPARVCVRSEV